MGRLVADAGKRDWEELTAEYGAIDAVAAPPAPPSRARLGVGAGALEAVPEGVDVEESCVDRSPQRWQKSAMVDQRGGRYNCQMGRLVRLS
jgi:hypothetical protein